MPAKFSNNASATLASAITTSSTVITVTAGQGAYFPTLSGSDYFFATLTDSSNNLEVVKCTARSGDSLTVTRAQDGTTARAYAAGDRIELRINAAAIDSKFDKEGGTITGNLSVNGNTTLGDASVDSVTVNAATIAYANSPSISGNPTYTGNVTIGDVGTDTFTIGAQLSANASVGTSGQVLSSRGASLSPQWISQSAIAAGSATSATSATTATNLAGGGVGQVPYQSASGTTAMLAAGTSGQFLQSNGSAAPSWANVITAPNMRVITTTGSFTIPAATLKVTCVGGGGNGGSSASTNSPGSGGGGGGGTSIAIVDGLTVGSSLTVTVGGATQTSSFGTYVSSTGGSSGVNNGAGGSGGNGTTTSSANVTYFINIPGGIGSNPSSVGGLGGSSLLGFGGRGGLAGSSGSGSSGSVYGGGGGGGGPSSTTKSAGGASGAGAAGIVIVEW